MSQLARNASKKRTLELRDVTVCVADCQYPQLAARALKVCMGRCAFGDAILFSDTAIAGPFRHVAVDRLKSREDYSRFCLQDMPRLTSTPYVLVIQWDGYVVDPAMWSAAFRRFDFVGAPIYPSTGGVFVGNGGFSLRSRRLLDALPRLEPAPEVPEDVAICQTYRERLERDFGVVFAPVPIAGRFSYEGKYPSRSTFGFHGAPNFWRHESDDEIVRIYEAQAPRELLNFSAFGLIMSCLQNGRDGLAVALYRRARTAYRAVDIVAEMSRYVPSNLARRTVDRLETGQGRSGPA